MQRHCHFREFILDALNCKLATNCRLLQIKITLIYLCICICIDLTGLESFILFGTVTIQSSFMGYFKLWANAFFVSPTSDLSTDF